MKEKLFFIFFLSIVLTPNAQEDLASADFIGPKENIHLHLNKTTFLQGEHLWFKAYVMDQTTKRPSLPTTNLHVGIYNDGGKEVKRKLFYVENGMAQGDFAIDSTLTDNEYTVLAWTNYMRNFKELEPFRQRIKILRDGMEEKTGEVEMKISVYPEGGQLIAGAYNNMGVLVDNGLGQGVQVDNLELVDESGNIIRSNITTNLFGMGKTGFLVEPQKNYFLQRKRPDGSLVRTKAPEAIRGQLGLNVDNNAKEKVLLTVLASEETFSEKDGDVHTLALYQGDFIRLEDIEVNKDEPVLSIDREELPFGVLTAVLFDTELHPVAHRMFFNSRKENNTVQPVEVEHCPTGFGDSIQVDMILPKGTNNDINISLSALPSRTDAYRPDNSIASAFLILPYVRSYFQDHYFFDGQDRRKRYELDNRLLIEGWGKFDWDSRKQEALQMAFEMETGISFQGKVINADLNEENQVSLIAELSAAMGFEELDKNKAFSANMPLFQGDSLRVSLISKKGKLKKPIAELQFTATSESIMYVPKWLKSKSTTRQIDSEQAEIVNRPLTIGNQVIALSEVTVTEKKQSKKFVISALAVGQAIDDAEIKRYGSLISYLGRLGFAISGIGGNPQLVLMGHRGGARPISVPITVDGRLTNLGQLMGMPLSQIAYVAYGKTPPTQFLSITSNPDYIPPDQRNKFIKFAIENGYARPQDYFTPNYPDYSSKVFKNYGALDWKASIPVGSEIPTSINIPVKAQTEVLLHLEGMATNGKVLAMSKLLDTAESNLE